MKHFALVTFACSVGVKVTASAEPQQVSYAGYQVVRVPVGNEVSKVVNIIEKLGLETWQEPHHAGAFPDIVVPPEELHAFNLQVTGLDVYVMHENLGALVVTERQPAEGVVFPTSEAVINSTWFTSYHQYLDHLQFMEGLVAQHPNHSEIVATGKSYQGNSISAIHIFGSSGKGVRPAVVFHGTVHAREWITTMSVEYFADFLLAHYDSDPETKTFVDKYDFYLYPIVNPDGFIYTQTSDRMWRENRQPNAYSTCLGTDINRNWPSKWGSTLNFNITTDPCEETYPALNEIERQQGLKLFIDWHSYSQVFLTTYGRCDYLAEDNTEMQSIASGAAEAMASLYDNVGGDYAFGVELRDRGEYGFVLPPDQILPTSREAFESVKYLLRNMK